MNWTSIRLSPTSYKNRFSSLTGIYAQIALNFSKNHNCLLTLTSNMEKIENEINIQSSGARLLSFKWTYQIHLL